MLCFDNVGDELALRVQDFGFASLKGVTHSISSSTEFDSVS